MVDRYCITTAGIYNTSMGEWVKAADYDALEAKLARLVAAGKTITTWLDECPPVDLIKGIDLWAKELKAAIEAVKVKP